MKKIHYIGLSLFWILGIGQPLYSLARILLTGRLYDFAVFYYPSAQAALYGVLDSNLKLLGFCPPTAIFFFVPFTLLPIFWAQIVWSFFSFFALMSSLLLLKKIFNLSLVIFLVIVPITMLSFPSKFTFGLGQINHFVLLAIVFTYYFSQKQKNIAAGVSLGLAMAMKIVPGLLLWYFLFTKNIKGLISAMVTWLVFIVVTYFSFGPKTIYYYIFKAIPEAANVKGKEIYFNQSFSGLISRLFIDHEIRLIFTRVFTLIVILVVTIIGIRFSHYKSKKLVPDQLFYSLLLVSLLIANGYSWQHHFILTIFPFVAMVSLVAKTTPGKAKLYNLALVIMCWVLISYNFTQRYMLPNQPLTSFILSHVFFGALFLWIDIINKMISYTKQ